MLALGIQPCIPPRAYLLSDPTHTSRAHKMKPYYTEIEMEIDKCPRCGALPTITPEGLYVCPRCGVVLGKALIDMAPRRKNNTIQKASDPLKRRLTRRIFAAKLYSAVATHTPRNSSPDPVVETVLEYLRLDKALTLGRKSRTLEAIAYAIVKLVEGYSITAAVREAARRYNVSEKTLRSLVSKHRSTIMLAKERVAESWRRSRINNT